MIASQKDQITTAQTAVIIINLILGTGILILPRTSVETVKTPDVWISVIFGGIVAMMAGAVIVKLCQRFPTKSFYEFSQEIVGKWVGGFLGLLIIGYFCATSSFQIRSMAEVTRYFLLEGTPAWAIVMPFMWVAFYLVIGGINPMARLYEIILPITVLCFLLVIIICFQVFELDNLRPVLGAGLKPVLEGVKTTALSYTGFEIMFILFAFMKQSNKAMKAMFVGIGIPLLFYLITVVMVIGAFSVDGVVTRTWPTIGLIRSVEITGLLFERFESLLLVLWIMQIFSTFSCAYYAAALGLAQLFNKDMYPFMLGLLPLLYIIAMTPKTINDVFALGDFLGNAAILLFGLLPLILLIVTSWRGKKHEAKAKE